MLEYEVGVNFPWWGLPCISQIFSFDEEKKNKQNLVKNLFSVIYKCCYDAVMNLLFFPYNTHYTQTTHKHLYDKFQFFTFVDFKMSYNSHISGGGWLVLKI